MIVKIVKFVLKTALILVVLAVVIAGAIGFVLAKWGRTPVAASTPAVSTPVPWGIAITVGNPAIPTAMPAILPTPTAPPPPPTAVPTAGQQYLLTGIWDPCCRPNDNWPVVAVIEGGNLFIKEFREGVMYPEFIAGPGVTEIISASWGWQPQPPGSQVAWKPFVTILYRDGGGIQTKEVDTRHKFGR